MNVNKNSKSQQEIVGFVLIVIIVVITGLIFLSFSIGRGNSVSQNSLEMSNFLESVMIYTTNCTINGYYGEMQDAIKSCYKNQNCDDGKNSCDEVKSELKKIINESLLIGDSSQNRAYNLSVYHIIVNSTNKENIFNLNAGEFRNCSSKSGASTSIVDNSIESGSINIELGVCKTD